MGSTICSTCIGIQLESTSSEICMKPVYVTANIYMIITKIDSHKNDGKIAHFPPPKPTLEALKGRSLGRDVVRMKSQ